MEAEAEVQNALAKSERARLEAEEENQRNARKYQAMEQELQ